MQPDVNKLNLFAEPKSKTDQSSGTSNSIPCVPHKFTVPPPSHPVPPHPPPSSQTQRAPPQVQHNGPPPPLMHVHHNQVPPPPPTECISQQSNIPTYEIVPSCQPSVLYSNSYYCTSFVPPPNATNGNSAANTTTMTQMLVVPNTGGCYLLLCLWSNPTNPLGVVSTLATRLMMARGRQREFHVPRPSCVLTSLLSLLERERSRANATNISTTIPTSPS